MQPNTSNITVWVPGRASQRDCRMKMVSAYLQQHIATATREIRHLQAQTCQQWHRVCNSETRVSIFGHCTSNILRGFDSPQEH